MNYLAHAYLSFNIPEITLGNLISDFVKGKQKFSFPPAIQNGIALHRAIDEFTDTHDITREAKTYFKAAYSLYSGPIVDIVYDHFLANDPLIFPPDNNAAALYSFSQTTYTHLNDLQELFPEKFARMFPYMKTQNWLYNYRHEEGIFNSLEGLARRARYMGSSDQAVRLFKIHYSELNVCYQQFFPQLQQFALRTLQEIQDPGLKAH